MQAQRNQAHFLFVGNLLTPAMKALQHHMHLPIRGKELLPITEAVQYQVLSPVAGKALPPASKATWHYEMPHLGQALFLLLVKVELRSAHVPFIIGDGIRSVTRRLV